MGTNKFNAGGNPAIDLPSISFGGGGGEGGGNTPSCLNGRQTGKSSCLRTLDSYTDLPFFSHFTCITTILFTRQYTF